MFIIFIFYLKWNCSFYEFYKFYNYIKVKNENKEIAKYRLEDLGQYKGVYQFLDHVCGFVLEHPVYEYPCE
jgi:hypothetical protein